MVGEVGDMNRALGKLGLSESPGPGRGLRLLCRLPPGDYRCCFLTAQIEVLRLAAGDHPPQGGLSVLVSGDTEVMGRASAGTLQAFGALPPTHHLPPSHSPLAVKPPKNWPPFSPKQICKQVHYKIFKSFIFKNVLL